jgi:lipopolysaccharide/colanic/teichoic acid biosynthesis glycosyltransferase
MSSEAVGPSEIGVWESPAGSHRWRARLSATARLDTSVVGGAAKRLLDVLVSLGALIVACPVFLVIAIVIKADSPGPVLFRHQRIGRYGRPFHVLKFRTMVPDADRRLREFLNSRADLMASWEASYKLQDDPRITRCGKFLRRFSLDELPQLVNVLRGSMSLVGPRPIVTGELPRFGDRASAVLRAKPGLTGLWAVSGRNDVTYEERVELEYRYVTTWSLGSDLAILLRTIPAVLHGHGTY